MDIMELIEELDAEIVGKKGLFSKKIDLERCAELVYELKNAMPKILRESDFVVSSRNKILENADIVAKNTIREAEERAEHIAKDSELIKRAESEAKSIIDSSYIQCNSMVDRTKLHLDSMFKDIEQFLLSNLNMIKNNREELRGAMVVKNKK